MAASDGQIAEAVLGLLARRPPGATICPSEAARALAPQDWRALMPRVRAVAATLALAGRLQILQGGRPVAAQGPWRGPIRLGRLQPGDGQP